MIEAYENVIKEYVEKELKTIDKKKKSVLSRLWINDDLNDFIELKEEFQYYIGYEDALMKLKGKIERGEIE